MAKTRELTVVIDGVEYVSKAAGDADKGLSSFTSKIPGYAKVVAGLAVAYQVVQAAVGKVTDFVGDSIAAYDRAAKSQLVLEGTSKLTGIALTDLQEAQEKIGKEFGLSKTLSGDLAVELGKLSQKAGDVSKMQAGMEAFLDLGASKGLNPEETLKAVQQSILGIDEGTDKLFGKNPSALYEEYAKKIGTSAGKLTDQQKAQALLTAAVEDGTKVQGAYGDLLETASGKQALLNTRMETAKESFGAAIQPLRLLILQGLAKLLEVAAPLIVRMGELANAVGVRAVGAFATLQEAAGKVIARIGEFVGKDEWVDLGKRWQQSAQETRDSIVAAAEARARAEQRTTDLIAAQAQRQIATNASVAASHDDRSTKTAAALERERKAREKYDAQMYAALSALQGNIDLTTGAFDRLGKKAELALPPGVAAEFQEAMRKASENAKDIAVNVQPVPESIRRAAVDVGGLARGALDAAQAFGVIDREAASALTSAANLAGAITKMATTGFSFAGVTGVLGGVANIVSVIAGGDAERRRLLRDNTVSLDRLRTQGIAGVGLSGSATSSIQSALASALPQVRGGTVNFGRDFVALMQSLQANNVSFSQLEELARNLGVGIRDSRGNFSFDALRQILDFLNSAGTGPGSGIASQLDALRDRLRVDGANQTTTLQQLAQFFTNASGAFRGRINLSDLDGSFASLRALLEDLDNNRVSLQSMGALSPAQFREALLELLGLVGELRGGTPGATSSASGPLTPTPGTTGPELPLPTVDAGALLTAIRDEAQKTTPLLTDQLSALSRIANATESSAEDLALIRERLDKLAESALLTGGLVESVDRSLGRLRQQETINAGVIPVVS